ncbi:hypothetical protein [Pseudomonas aeruginosa]|uniref:hypothetical protein n=1 Tax=Pseudomonas aeruginosa TaxID=287 RepID=UPI0032B4EF30
MAITLPIPEPSSFSSWNRSLQGAYRKGAVACLEGKALSDCPYEDKRKDDGRLSWSRSYITAWTDGYRDAERHQASQSAIC